MIWPTTFADRLDSWVKLRDRCQTAPVESSLDNINRWWFGTPWRAYYLHWDDQEIWPDPWQLLEDNVYCDLARALGILYTVTLLERTDLSHTHLVLTESGHNLVLANKTKYILNWNQDSIVNNNQAVNIRRKYETHPIV